MTDEATGPARGAASRRGYAGALLLGLLSAAAVTAAVSRPWYEATATSKNLPKIEAAASGADLVPMAGSLGLVLLAAFGAVIATRGWLRRGIGLLIVASALVVLGTTAAPGGTDEVLRAGLSARGWSGGGYASTATLWRWLSLLGAAGCIAAGAAVVRFGARWPTMGHRYDAPGRAADPAEAPGQAGAEPDGSMPAEELWRALDQGRDPTQRP